MSEINETPSITFSNETDLKLLLSFTKHGIFLYEKFLVKAKDERCEKDFINKIQSDINKGNLIKEALELKIDRFNLVADPK